jgi:hypothetical protein
MSPATCASTLTATRRTLLRPKRVPVPLDTISSAVAPMIPAKLQRPMTLFHRPTAPFTFSAKSCERSYLALQRCRVRTCSSISQWQRSMPDPHVCLEELGHPQPPTPIQTDVVVLLIDCSRQPPDARPTANSVEEAGVSCLEQDGAVVGVGCGHGMVPYQDQE